MMLDVQLSLLFTGMLRHGFTPHEMLLSTIIPIPMNSCKSLSNSENYRAITLFSAIGKVLDWVIIYGNTSQLSSFSYQFGYKQSSSTTQCTFVVNESIKYYQNDNSDVYVVLLDATKDFDRVDFIQMFKTLLQRKLCPMLCRFLAMQ